jgi:hypothetical protein
LFGRNNILSAKNTGAAVNQVCMTDSGSLSLFLKHHNCLLLFQNILIGDNKMGNNFHAGILISLHELLIQDLFHKPNGNTVDPS